MRLRATLSFLLFAGTIYGQSTLTGANLNPQAGETFVYFDDSSHFSAPINGGANVTWDFSAFTFYSMSNHTSSFITCSSTPECDYFMGSNLAIGDPAYGYFYLSATSFSLTEIGGYNIGYDTAQFTGDIILQYPFTYNSSFTTNYIEYFHSTGQFNEYQYGPSTTTCDGYGTLITPAGTYQNVLMVHNITYNTDSAIDIITGTTNVTNDTEIYYDWYMPGYHTDLFEVKIYSDGSGPDTSARYSRQITTAITAINKTQQTFELFPNPANDKVTIKFSLTEAQPVSVAILDMLGRQVAVVGNDKYVAGEHQLSYNTASLPKGLYLVQLKSGTDDITRKLEVQ